MPSPYRQTPMPFQQLPLPNWISRMNPPALGGRGVGLAQGRMPQGMGLGQGLPTGIGAMGPTGLPPTPFAGQGAGTALTPEKLSLEDFIARLKMLMAQGGKPKNWFGG